jgi:hypothetical protein
MEQSPSWEPDQFSQLAKKFPVVYGTRSFFTVLTSARFIIFISHIVFECGRPLGLFLFMKRCKLQFLTELNYTGCFMKYWHLSGDDFLGFSDQKNSIIKGFILNAYFAVVFCYCKSFPMKRRLQLMPWYYTPVNLNTCWAPYTFQAYLWAFTCGIHKQSCKACYGSEWDFIERSVRMCQCTLKAVSFVKVKFDAKFIK